VKIILIFAAAFVVYEWRRDIALITWVFPWQ